MEKIINLNENNLNSVMINIILHFSYTTDTSTFANVAVTITKNLINLNLLFDYLVIKCSRLKNSAISYFDNDLKTFIFLGIYPFNTIITFPYSCDIHNLLTTLQFKSRQIIEQDSFMRMDLAEEITEQDETNQNIFISSKSKRSKERKIGFVIEKVFLWRKLYNGFVDSKGNFIKLTLEEAADQVGISKKSLDDYLIQLRIGKQNGFLFNEHKNDKIGVLRAFVKRQKFTLVSKQEY